MPLAAHGAEICCPWVCGCMYCLLTEMQYGVKLPGLICCVSRVEGVSGHMRCALPVGVLLCHQAPTASG